MTKYKVELVEPLGFPADQRVRSGIVVTKAEGYEGELSDEQLKAIEADDYLKVEEVKAEAPRKTETKSKK